MIVAYVSGHGFGHVTRTMEVLRAVRERAPTEPLCVVGSPPSWLAREMLGNAVELRAEECDVGLAQRGPLVIDVDATVKRWREFVSTWEARVEREREWLLRVGARVVLGDVPPLAFEAATRAHLPSVALANFSWDWVFRHFAERHPAMRDAADWAASAYARATLLLRLPFTCDLSAFPRIEDIPLVARQPRLPGNMVRQRLGLAGLPLVLWSFGGHGQGSFDFEPLGSLHGFRFVVGEGAVGLPPNVVSLGQAAMSSLGVSYIDLVAAADVVVTKAGYGIVSDALGARTPLVYTDRGDFPEYPVLVREMTRYLPCAYVPSGDLATGRIGPLLEELRTAEWPRAPRLDGAAVAAQRILELASG